jgi:hypothetical protein
LLEEKYHKKAEAATYQATNANKDKRIHYSYNHTESNEEPITSRRSWILYPAHNHIILEQNYP